VKKVLYLLLLVVAVGVYFYFTRCRPDFAGEGGEADRPTAGASHTLAVDFKDDMDHDAIARLGQSLGVSFRPASSQFDIDEIYTVETSDPAGLLKALEGRADVEAADYEIEYGLPEDSMILDAEDEGLVADADAQERGFPNDPKYKYQWHLNQIHVAETWKAAQGEGAIVAVIDTGVARVPDLAQTVMVPGYNFVDNNDNATDDHGHGTHVAGTIAQSTNNGVGVAGVAFKAKIMPIKVLSARGSGSVSGIAEGIRWAADHGANVINMSLGGGMSTSVLANAVKYAHDKGVTVVCAAGNDGRGKVSYPAAYKHSVAVAATQFDEKTTFYSNWGKEIDVAAPGGNTQVDQNNDGMKDGVLQNTVVPGDTSKNDYLLFMGTSMASPHVAGVAALIVGAGVKDPDAVEKILKETARKPSNKSDWEPTKGPENRYGAGIVDARAAVKKAQLGEGGSALGIGAGLAALVLLGLRRRALLAAGLGLGGVVALVAAASGLFFLPQVVGVGIPGVAIASHGLAALGGGSPITLSALIPLVLVMVLYGKARARGPLAGLSLGWAGWLLSHAFFRTVDVSFVPNALDGVWLVANALLLVVTARAVLRK
jgi:serine protease